MSLGELDPEYFQRLLRDLSPRPDEQVDLFVEERTEVVLLAEGDEEPPPAEVVREAGFAFRVAAPGQTLLRAGSPASEVRMREVFRELAGEFGVEPFFRKPERRGGGPATPPPPDHEARELEAEAREVVSRIVALARRARAGLTGVRIRLGRRRRIVLPREKPLRSGTRPELNVSFTVRRGERVGRVRAGAVRYDAGLDAYLVRAISAAIPDEAAKPFPSRVPLTAVFAEGTAATFFHELVGHLLEADALAEGLSPLLPVLGATVAPPSVTVHDDPTREELPGAFRFDDEGNPAVRQALLDRGRVGVPLGDAIHRDFGPPGRARRASWGDPPLPRITNLVVEPGKADFDSMLSHISRGVLVTSLGGGSVDPASGRFSLAVSTGRMIRRGELGAPCEPVWIAGDLFPALEMIRPEIGEELAVDYGATVCTRRGQAVPVGGLAPLLAVPGLVTAPKGS